MKMSACLLVVIMLAACSTEAPQSSKQSGASLGSWSKKTPMAIRISEVTVGAAIIKSTSSAAVLAILTITGLIKNMTLRPTSGVIARRCRAGSS